MVNAGSFEATHSRYCVPWSRTRGRVYYRTAPVLSPESNRSSTTSTFSMVVALPPFVSDEADSSPKREPCSEGLDHVT